MKKQAFSLIEIVMVIVVLGIVAMIGTNILTSMYESYIRTKITNSLQAKTTHVLDIIAKRLTYRVKDSLVTSIDGDPATYMKLSDVAITNNHNILEWIGYDNEGFVGEWDTTANSFRGWNGFADLDDTANTQAGKFITPGSRLDLAKDTIFDLSYGQTNLSTMTAGSSAAVIFQCSFNTKPISYGYLDATHTNIWRANILANDKFIVQNPGLPTTNYCERYLLSWSAYAIEPGTVSADGDFDLFLRYNYQPWENERYSTGTQVLLSEHVTTFRFIQLGRTVRVKLCITDQNQRFAVCKEKAIF